MEGLRRSISSTSAEKVKLYLEALLRDGLLLTPSDDGLSYVHSNGSVDPCYMTSLPQSSPSSVAKSSSSTHELDTGEKVRSAVDNCGSESMSTRSPSCGSGDVPLPPTDDGLFSTCSGYLSDGDRDLMLSFPRLSLRKSNSGIVSPSLEEGNGFQSAPSITVDHNGKGETHKLTFPGQLSSLSPTVSDRQRWISDSNHAMGLDRKGTASVQSSPSFWHRNTPNGQSLIDEPIPDNLHCPSPKSLRSCQSSRKNFRSEGPVPEPWLSSLAPWFNSPSRAAAVQLPRVSPTSSVDVVSGVCWDIPLTSLTKRKTSPNGPRCDVESVPGRTSREMDSRLCENCQENLVQRPSESPPYRSLEHKGEHECVAQKSRHKLCPHSPRGPFEYLACKTCGPDLQAVAGSSFKAPTAIFPSFNRLGPLTDTYLQRNMSNEYLGQRRIVGLHVRSPTNKSASIHESIIRGYGPRSPSQSFSPQTSLASRRGMVYNHHSTPVSGRHISSRNEVRSHGSGSPVMHPVTDNEIRTLYLDGMDVSVLLQAVDDEMAVGDVKESVQKGIRMRLRKAFEENQASRREVEVAEEVADLRREMESMRNELQKQREYLTDITETMVNPVLLRRLLDDVREKAALRVASTSREVFLEFTGQQSLSTEKRLRRLVQVREEIDLGLQSTTYLTESASVYKARFIDEILEVGGPYHGPVSDTNTGTEGSQNFHGLVRAIEACHCWWRRELLRACFAYVRGIPIPILADL